MPPLVSYLIGPLGWRETYLILRGLVAVVGIGMSLLIEDDPRLRGLAPDAEIQQAGPREPHHSGMSVREPFRPRRLIGPYSTCLIFPLGLFVPFLHLLPFAL